MSAVETASSARWSVPVRVVAFQVLAGGALAVAALAWGAETARETLVGAMVAFLPNAGFAWSITRAGRSAPAGAVLQAGMVLVAWGVKLVLTVALLVLAIGVAGMGSLAFFVGLGTVLAVSLASPMMAPRDDEPPRGADRDEGGKRTEVERRPTALARRKRRRA